MRGESLASAAPRNEQWVVRFARRRSCRHARRRGVRGQARKSARMKKFLYAAAVALVFCAAQARAAGFQADSVRVGPASDEKAVDGTEAPAPKKDDKKGATSNETRGERRADAAKESAGAQDGDKKKESRADEKSQVPSTLSNSTASTVTSSGSDKPSATSDAPARLGTDTTVPVVTPAGNKTSPTGGTDSNKTDSNKNGPSSSTSNPTASNPTASATNPSVP